MMLCLSLLYACTDDQRTQAPASPTSTDHPYDADLAAKYDADEYGMGTYVMAFLKDGPQSVR